MLSLLPVLSHVFGEWRQWAGARELGLRGLRSLALELPVQPFDDQVVPAAVHSVSGVLAEEDGWGFREGVEISLALFSLG